MIGMISGNGHPYSWSAIINGFDPAAMARCPYPVIPHYLGAQPEGSVKIPGAQVTHLWTDSAADAAPVAQAALIPRIVAHPQEVIGEVDAVFIATDDGFDHVRRARLFVEAGLPVFIDKPLALTPEDLRTFIGWQKAGARLLSSSGLRYAPELAPFAGTPNPTVGGLRWISGVCCKTWERYGIHLLEPIARVLGPGFESVRLESPTVGAASLREDAAGVERNDERSPARDRGANPLLQTIEVAHLTHRSGVQVSLPVIHDGGATFGTLHLCGTAGQAMVRMTDTYHAFRTQLVTFIEYARTGTSPYPFSETVELMTVLIAGIRSRNAGSRRVELAEITSELCP